MYRITYTVGNGYYCSCCRRTDTYTNDYEDHEYDKMCKWIIEHMADIKKPRYSDADDFSIDSIEKELGKDISNDIINELEDEIHNEILSRICEDERIEMIKEEQKILKEKEQLRILLEKYGVPNES